MREKCILRPMSFLIKQQNTIEKIQSVVGDKVNDKASVENINPAKKSKIEISSNQNYINYKAKSTIVNHDCKKIEDEYVPLLKIVLGWKWIKS